MTAMDGVWHKSSYSNDTGGACVEMVLTWRKSSYSNASGGECVEVAETWHKSSYSNSTGGDCVEVADSLEKMLVRDTQHRAHGHLAFPAPEWATFMRELKDGRL